MSDTITLRLRELEHHGEYRILYAVESGSRAWGCASTDSDYDPRFVYVRPLEHYLRLFDGRDNIEGREGAFDYQGWDVRKALQLASKSNPAILEWLHSPTVYIDRDEFAKTLNYIMNDFSPRALMHHYISLAARQFRAYWKQGQDVRFKKYIYAVRPICAVHWMEQNDYRMPPIDIKRLVSEVDVAYNVRVATHHLLDMKAKSTESTGSGRIPVLDDFIECGVSRGHAAASAAPVNEPDKSALEQLLISTILVQWRPPA